jgi:hypothetical protein
MRERFARLALLALACACSDAAPEPVEGASARLRQEPAPGTLADPPPQRLRLEPFYTPPHEWPDRQQALATPVPPATARTGATCQRTQQEIFTTLGKHLAKVNVCVQDEKARAPMPSTMPLAFVIAPTGRTRDVEVMWRERRGGPLQNCLIKAFQMMDFGVSDGGDCPVEIPVKIDE